MVTSYLVCLRMVTNMWALVSLIVNFKLLDNHFIVLVEVLIDGLGGSGSIIIDPSFVERRLRVQAKSSVAAHSLLAYKEGLSSVADAAQYMAQIVKPFTDARNSSHGAGPADAVYDSILAAMHARSLIEEKEAENKRIRDAVLQMEQQKQEERAIVNGTIRPASNLSLTSLLLKSTVGISTSSRSTE
jgi:hypothetical protein